MKSIEPLIDGLQSVLLEIPELADKLGVFSDSQDPSYSPIAIAYNSLPENYTVPKDDKAFIIYSIDSINPKKREGRSFLQDVTLKFYIGGYDAFKIADILIGQLERANIYTYTVSYDGIVKMPNGDITLRFNLI